MDEIFERFSEFPGMKTDQDTGILYFEELPKGFSEATLDDFHVHGMKKIGMIYLVRGYSWNVYFPKIVTESLIAKALLPHIQDSRVFIKK